MSKRMRLIAACGFLLLLPLGWFARSEARSAKPAPIPAPRSSFGWAVGDLLPPLEWKDIDGDVDRTADWRGRQATVIVARDLDCPVSKRYAPRLAALQKAWAAKGVEFVNVHFNPKTQADAVRAQDVKNYGLSGSFVLDPDGKQLGRPLQFRSTTEVLVVDGAGTLAYRGALDDQHGVTYARPGEPTPFLEEALAAVVAGRPVELAETEAPGCLLGFDAEEPVIAAREVTYHNRASRILARNCTSCHRAGGVGPFDLTDYDTVRFYRFMIEDVIERGLMPPWTANAAHGDWSNERRLTESEHRDLMAWLNAGAPEGDPSTAVRPAARVAGWNIGEPDAIVSIPKPIDVPAEGVVDYQYVYAKTSFPEDRWIQAMEIRPTAPEVMHHVLVFIEDPEVQQRRSEGDRSARPQGGLSGFFAVTVPGFEANVYPEGSAKLLPAGAWLKFQLHYTPNGTATRDQTRIGLVFADEPPIHPVRTVAVFDTRFEIPPGAANHEVSASANFSKDSQILTFFPHMHLRGKAFRYTLERPDGSSEILLDVPRYDFNWQMDYRAARPVEVPQGSRLTATGWFDNSKNNPANPDPSATVRFGEQTFDEMMIGYIDYIRIEETATPKTTASSSSGN